MYQIIEAKIRTLLQTAEIVRKWQSEQLQVVWTNGCFDLLHLGHIKYLSQARDLGDKLVIGVNTDASVARLKGPNRPAIDQHTRAIKLAAFEFCDGVVLFDEDTPLECITTIKPNILVKGGDYHLDQIVGAKEMQQWGGKVAIIPFEPGHSSSSIIDKIKTTI
jgi:rfaE bifunctional protein nucleotidyltransferase chain/domain